MSKDLLEVTYLAFGYRYLVMAVNSARSLRFTGSVCRTKLLTNLPLASAKLDDTEYFDEIVVVPGLQNAENRSLKTRIFDYAACQSNLFLDCDTIVRYPLHKLLPVSSRFDVAIAAEPISEVKRDELSFESGACPFNTGVIFFQKTERTAELFRLWNLHYREMNKGKDQISFLRAVVEARPTILPLGASWNATPWAARDLDLLRRRPDSIKIIHYRDPVCWPSVGPDLAYVHDRTVWNFNGPVAELQQEIVRYGTLVKEYKSRLFSHSIGRQIIQARRQLTALCSGVSLSRLRSVSKLRQRGERWDRKRAGKSIFTRRLPPP